MQPSHPLHAVRRVGFRASGGEDFARLSEGIHGVKSLSADVWDWRNPAVKITLRLNGNDE
ncbi:MAG: hypothetical protein MSG64_07750 [Pyrinomonadaceae bacterium MAG19_C2-C3]|nr:hypothetical protein [Pyrinomonadaceae bacterium MAG19_C2-C3]